MIFLSPGDAEGETSEKLEFDDPLNEHAMFLRSQGFQNEATIVSKLVKRMKRITYTRKERKKREEKREEKVWKSEKIGKTGPGGSTMRLRGSQDHPRGPFGRPKVPRELSGGAFRSVLGLSWGIPERS